MEGGDVNITKNEEGIKLEPNDSSTISKAKQTLVETAYSNCTSATPKPQNVPAVNEGSELNVKTKKVIGTKTKKNVRPVPTKRKRELGKRVPCANNTDSYEGTWSEIDKQRLLIALQRFGVMDINSLSKAVPGRSEEDIKKYINFKWRMTRIELRSNLRETRKLKGDKSPYLGPIDKWLEILENSFPKLDHYKTNPLAHAVLLIWKYEKHPDPSECGGVDFKALYEYLYCMLCGFPPKHLNQPTAIYLSASLKNFACGIRNADWDRIIKFLTSPMTVSFPKKADINEEDIPAAFSFTKEQCLDELIKMPGFNPFCVPRDHLRKKVSVVTGEDFTTVAHAASLTATPSTITASTSNGPTIIPDTASTSNGPTIIPVTASTSNAPTIIPVTASTSNRPTIIPVTASTSSKRTVIPVSACKRTVIPVTASTSSKRTITPVSACTSNRPTVIPVTASTSSKRTVIPVSASTFCKRTVSTSSKHTVIPITVISSSSSTPTITLATTCTSTTPTTIPATATSSTTPSIISVSPSISTSGARTGRTYSRTSSNIPNASQTITKVSTTTPSVSVTPRRVYSRTISKESKPTTTNN